jgi:hypothetical protein
MPQKDRAAPERKAGKADADKARADPNCPPRGNHADEFEPTIDLPGKTDSGPEPDVFGKEIPPQK